ncbi:hypothetical protein NEOLEDRAFT_1071368 [Neolentinus lepideus HHB14362 ss-1]|uniref:Actin-like ATPase domain-containing protein n=1 Tax=Neolentinus lepideus HHB14362 ss-1 TaxID=1314782 RepID=A0A165QHE9_9AGAM|nr:hypothetical protein NEOLEDRAFT_1071368 [Neolentinus lepideus HHB14362 ss-1]
MLLTQSQFREPYDGSSRKLVLALDIGTTFSGISYTILDPGQIPKIFTVTTYPGQTKSGGDSKIPSIIYYDVDGVVEAVGQEAENLRESGEAEDNDWIRVQWHLHLRPNRMNAPHITDDQLPRLPVLKTIIDVFADFLAYLFSCAKGYIRTAHAAGDALLLSLEGNIDFVMGHPNGWGGPQQQRMRKAAVHAGLVPDMEAAQKRIQFVTEGEASLYYCLENGLSSDVIKPDNKIMIVDVGGGTIDLSSYRITKIGPVRAEEVAAPGCRLQGSSFVNDRASTFLLAEKLKGSIYDDPQEIENIVQSFEKTVKRIFKASTGTVHIRFGSRNDNDPEYGISKGVLKLTGKEVSGFFDPSLDAMLDAIQEQRREGGDIKTIFLVGGFAANDYLFGKLRGELAGIGVEISRPDGYTNKAVADGALAFYLDHVVSKRVARITYGVEGTRSYDPSKLSHMVRLRKIFVQPSGRRMLPDAYLCIVSKGSKIDTEEEYSEDFFRESATLNTVISISVTITTYSGDSVDPQWTDVDPESYHTLCTINANVSQAARSLKPMRGPSGQLYYQFHFRIVLNFGLTELKAHMRWTEDVSRVCCLLPWTITG